MARELNREIFGNRNQESTGPAPANQPSAYAKVDDVRMLSLHIEAQNKKMKEFEARLETMHTKLEDMLKVNKQRFERVQGHFQNQGEVVKNAFSDINTKIAQVASRVNERKVADGVVKEMVDRSTQCVQGFEIRLQQLQRVISEQELQLTNARAQLKDALQELTRLKKF